MGFPLINTDVVIIGAGPVGIFAAFQSGMLGMKSHVIDPLLEIGGQCTALYPEKPIYDIPGFPSITARKLISNLVDQASPFKPVYHLGDSAQKILDDSNDLLVVTKNGVIISCKGVIIAAGSGAFAPKRPPLFEIENYEEKSVFYSVGEISKFYNKKVVIAGGGDSAADWAVELSKVASHISVIHRRKSFRCTPDTEDKLNSLFDLGKIELLVPYQLCALNGLDGELCSVSVKSIDGQKTKNIAADYLLPFFGIESTLGPILNWDLAIEKNHILVDQSTCRSSREKVYAVGDIALYKNKIKLILTGFSEVTMACHDLYKSAFPNSPFNFQHSTTKGIDLNLAPSDNVESSLI